MPAWKMQAVGRFVLHGNAKGIPFEVMSSYWPEETDRPCRSNDNDNNRKRCSANQQFPSQWSKVTKLYRYKVTKPRFVTLLTFNQSFGLARHSQLRKKKSVHVGQLFDALIQRSADAVTCTRARPQ